MANTSDDLPIFSRNSNKILVGNAVAAGCGIPMEFCLEFQLIPNSAKSAVSLQSQLLVM